LRRLGLWLRLPGLCPGPLGLWLRSSRLVLPAGLVRLPARLVRLLERRLPLWLLALLPGSLWSSLGVGLLLGRRLWLRLGSLAMDGRLILLVLHSLLPLPGRPLILLTLLGLEAGI